MRQEGRREGGAVAWGRLSDLVRLAGLDRTARSLPFSQASRAAEALAIDVGIRFLLGVHLLGILRGLTRKRRRRKRNDA